jgi:hypothetical protein
MVYSEVVKLVNLILREFYLDYKNLSGIFTGEADAMYSLE